MTYPTAAVNTTNLDASGDSPALARSDILDAIQKLNQMIAHTTAFAATLLDDANAATARATLGALGASDTIANATNAATAAACSGNAATATTAAACSGNAATATTASNAIGVGQTWQNVTGSRTTATYYTNSTGRSIHVCASCYSPASSSLYTAFEVAGVVVSEFQLDGSPINASIASHSVIVPNGATYRMTTSGSSFYNKWFELR